MIVGVDDEDIEPSVPVIVSPATLNTLGLICREGASLYEA